MNESILLIQDIHRKWHKAKLQGFIYGFGFFVMTQTDSDHMLVHWIRIVNNLDMHKDKKGSKFSSAGMGVLTRKATM